MVRKTGMVWRYGHSMPIKYPIWSAFNIGCSNQTPSASFFFGRGVKDRFLALVNQIALGLCGSIAI